METQTDDPRKHHPHAAMAAAKPKGVGDAMKITVAGLWHLGCVTAACCAKHFQVTGLDFDSATIARLTQGKAPLFEPGLNELIAEGLANHTLAFTDDPKA